MIQSMQYCNSHKCIRGDAVRFRAGKDRFVMNVMELKNKFK